ncbi:MAG: hypothetical protein RR365_15255 [Bacteroides sp.]
MKKVEREYISYRCPDGRVITDWNGTLWKYGHPAYPKSRCIELERGNCAGGINIGRVAEAMKKKYGEKP